MTETKGEEPRAIVETPPHRIGEKVAPEGGKPLDQALIDAEAAIAALAGEYRRHLAGDVAALTDLMARYRDAGDPGALQRMFRIVHNMRGQAATFGFPLITEVGRSFCLYVMETPEDQLRTDLIELHVTTLRRIHEEDIDDRGDVLTREIVHGLMRAVELEGAKNGIEE